uniref:Uncharacterized protein n=1 Tax=uncultured prokaryote TaxID=198431 RepID=A0A0H5PZX9_9ZZZZ|nr:hypothetical protein [uncultured prokaryote]
MRDGCTVRTVLTVAVDVYDSRGNLVSSVLGARASSVDHDAHDVIEHVGLHLPADWRQMTYDEIVEWRGQTSSVDRRDWEQLSIF